MLQSEYTATPDHRRQWVSGFTGSLGDLVVTQTEALLWTDSRYWVQAAREMDCSWTLMRKGNTEVRRLRGAFGATRGGERTLENQLCTH